MSHRQATYRVPASATLDDGTLIEGEIFLQTATPLHEGGEIPTEMLNRSELFYAILLSSGEFTLVSKAQTAVLSCESSFWDVDLQRRAISRRFRLEVQMAGGKRLRGDAFWELPSSHPRPQDFLNVPDAFFELIEDGTSHSINRSLVAQVRPDE